MSRCPPAIGRSEPVIWENDGSGSSPDVFYDVEVWINT